MANRAAQIAAALFAIAASAGDLPASAPDLRAELDPTGRIDDLAISPSGQLWFGTATGHAYASFDLNRSWQEMAVTARRDDPGPPYSFDTDQLGRFVFFDEQRGLVVGYIGKAKDTVYRTSDGGRTWSPVLLPSSLWVYDAQATAAGLAWLVGSTGEVLHSEDFGLTWRALASPFDSSSRSHSVHFDSPLYGVVGALKDSLAVTSDGGRTWRPIATPAQRGLTGECVPDGRFEKVRFLGERLVVEQCGAVYAALAGAEPAWSELRAGTRPLLGFELHPDGLVAVAADREIVFFDHGLAVVQATGYALGAAPKSIAVEGHRIAILENVLPATERTCRRVPYVERAFFIEVLAGRKGWVAGWTHHLGNFAFRSADGGRSWRPEPFEERPYEKLERLGGGTWAAIEVRQVLTWSDGRFVPSKRFDDPIRWLRVAAAGALLVELADRAAKDCYPTHDPASCRMSPSERPSISAPRASEISSPSIALRTNRESRSSTKSSGDRSSGSPARECSGKLARKASAASASGSSSLSRVLSVRRR
jgi:photosystem II stability/assembly factor-like uncharacterized protein